MPTIPTEPGIGAIGQPFGCVAGIQPDMTPDRVAALLPKLQRGKNASGQILTTPASAPACIVEFNALDRLDELEIGFPGDVAKAWGAGDPTDDGAVYLDAAHTMRARLDHNGLLKLFPMVPLDTQLATLFDLVGRPAAEVDARYAAQRLPRDSFIKPPSLGYRLPATEWTERPTVDYHVDATGSVSQVSSYMYFDNAGGEAAVRAALARRFGPAKGNRYGPIELQPGDRRATLVANAPSTR